MSDLLTRMSDVIVLIKRELFAAMAMQGLLAYAIVYKGDEHELARDAVKTADALLKALEEKKE